MGNNHSKRKINTLTITVKEADDELITNPKMAVEDENYKDTPIDLSEIPGITFNYKSTYKFVKTCCCDICLHDYIIDEPLQLLPCGHVLHHDCITRWFYISQMCPICNNTFIDN